MIASAILLCACTYLVTGNGVIEGSSESLIDLKSSPIWPQPTSLSLGSQRIQLNNYFTFEQMQTSKSSLLERGMRRYEKLILGSSIVQKEKMSAYESMLSQCGIAVATILPDDQEASSLDLNVDESYVLNISATECLIQSKTVWGALHAMETFTQLLKRDTPQTVVCDYLPVSITNSPRYSHRGLLVDTSRHYLSMDTLKKAVDSLVLTHFNVLHWHIVDAQSFPFNSPSAPEIIKGAYSPELTYTVEQIKELSLYATDRGVRILYEVDVPGHAASWGAGYPSVIPQGCPEKYSYNINNWALNPALDETYSLLTSILRDIKDATGTKYLHLGGDEVVYGCWSTDPSITKFMADNNLASYSDLFSMFITKADGIAASLGATPIHWEDVFIAGVKTAPNTIFNVWTNSVQIANVTSAGYSVIAAPSDYWYLDHAENTWQVMYSYDPTSNITSHQAELIIGGEAAMWGEKVDEDNFFQKVWPTAAAVGERLWSPKTTTDTTDALNRLLVFRCRMQDRGFPSTPVQPGFCGTHYV